LLLLADCYLDQIAALLALRPTHPPNPRSTHPLQTTTNRFHTKTKPHPPTHIRTHNQVAQRWRFASDPKSVQRAASAPAQVLPNARLSDLGAALSAKGYQVFREGRQLYAFKGLAGRLGPIGVHAALLLALGGTAYSGFGGWRGSAMVPEGQEFLVAQAISPASAISRLPRGAKAVMHVNGFRIETRPDGSVAQFYSDLSLRDLDTDEEVLRKTISVNDPFRCGLVWWDGVGLGLVWLGWV